MSKWYFASESLVKSDSMDAIESEGVEANTSCNCLLVTGAIAKLEECPIGWKKQA